MKTRKLVLFAFGALLFGAAVLTPGVTSTARAAGGCGIGQNAATSIGQQTLQWQMLSGNHQDQNGCGASPNQGQTQGGPGLSGPVSQAIPILPLPNNKPPQPCSFFDIFVEIPCTSAGNGTPPIAIGQQPLPWLPWWAPQWQLPGCQCLQTAVFPDTPHAISGGVRDLLKSPDDYHVAIWIPVQLWVTCLDPINKSNTCTIPFDITQKADWTERAPFTPLDSGTAVAPLQSGVGFKSGGTGAPTTDISTKMQISCTTVCDGVPHLFQIWLVYEANFDAGQVQGQLLTGHLSFTINAEGCGKTIGEPSFDLTVKL